MATTIIYPSVPIANYAYTISRSSGAPPNPSPTALPTPVFGTTLSARDFVLYLPFTAKSSTTVTWSTIVDALGGDGFGQRSEVVPAVQTISGQSTAALSGSTVAVPPGGVLFIPVVKALPAQVTLENLITSVENLAASALTGTATSATTTGQTVTSTGMTQSGASPPSSDRIPSPTSTSSSSTATASTSPGASQNGQGHQNITGGALAGGIVGAFIVGALLCFVIGFCLWRRRRSGRPGKDIRSDGSSFEENPLAQTREIPMSHFEKENHTEPVIGMMGWQKHLPQEKDNAAISNTVRSVFHQIEIHMEGYYQKRRDTPKAAIVHLRELSGDSLPDHLLGAGNDVPILGGILTRWGVHRISGRSTVEQTLLPGVFAEFAKRSQWDMERDDKHDGTLRRTMTQKKRGYPQAFAQWRQLTGFLSPDLKNDPTFQRELSIKLEQGVETLDAAFSPWEANGKSSEDRRRSLRKILLDISNAGLLLIIQPSDFLFDWSTKERSDGKRVTITPALMRLNDSDADSSSAAETLVEPTHVTI